MGAGADQTQVVTIDFIDEQPIRFQVAVAVVLPRASERVVFVVGRKRVALAQSSKITARSFDISLARR